MKYTQTGKQTHTCTQTPTENSNVSQRGHLPDQISFVLHLDEAVHIIQPFTTLNLNKQQINNKFFEICLRQLV